MKLGEESAEEGSVAFRAGMNMLDFRDGVAEIRADELVLCR